MTIDFAGFGVHIPYPDPDAVFAPEGRFVGVVTLTGDVSGGTAQLRIRTDRSREFVYLLDTLAVESATGDPGEALVLYTMYLGESLAQQSLSYRSVGSFTTAQGRRYPRQELTPPAALLGAPRGSGELITLCTFNWQANVNTLVYTLAVSGRYYRRNLVYQPGFLRAVLEGRA